MHSFLLLIFNSQLIGLGKKIGLKYSKSIAYSTIRVRLVSHKRNEREF